MKSAAHFPKASIKLQKTGVSQSIQIHLGATKAVIPPDGNCVAFDQLKESAQYRIRERSAGRAAICVRDTELRILWRRVVHITQRRRKVFFPSRHQRSCLAPVDLDG